MVEKKIAKLVGKKNIVLYMADILIKLNNKYFLFKKKIKYA